MKIALFVHCFFPEHFYGTETYTLEVAKNLQSMGHSPVVVSAVFPGEPKRDSVITRYEYEGVPVYCIDKNFLPIRRLRDSYYQVEMRGVLTEALLAIKPDLVHVAHLGNHTAVLLEVVNTLRIPVMATLTDFFGICFTSRLEAADGSLCKGPNRTRTNCIACALKEAGRNRRDHPLFRWLGQWRWASIAAPVLRRIHPLSSAALVEDLVQRPRLLSGLYEHYQAVVAPTRFLAKAYKSNGLQVPMHRISFGIDMPKRNRAMVPGSPLRFGFIGQLAIHKGPDILIEAFVRLSPGAAELRLYGAGATGDPYVTSLKSGAKGHAISFLGTFPSEQIADVLSDMDFLVIPSRWYENSPLVLLGALASHTPVIVSDVEGMSEFVEHGKNGFLFQRGNSNALNAILRELTQEPDTARAMCADTHYRRSTRMMTEDLVRVYESVIAGFAGELDSGPAG